MDPTRVPETKDLLIGDGYFTSNEIVITKMTQKLKKDPDAPKGKAIKKITFDMDKNTITVQYHFEPG